MTKTYYDNEFVTINYVLKIEFVSNKIILEYQVDVTEFDDEDSSIFNGKRLNFEYFRALESGDVHACISYTTSLQ